MKDFILLPSGEISTAAAHKQLPGCAWLTHEVRFATWLGAASQTAQICRCFPVRQGGCWAEEVSAQS